MSAAETLPTIPAPALDAIALGTPERAVPPPDGFDIEAVPSHRGETRVWQVRMLDPPARWYVKRIREPQVFRRYLAGLRILGRNESPGSELMPVRWAGQDDSHRLVATYPLPGTSVEAMFIQGTRLDKLLSWPRSDLPGLARQVGRGLLALWGHRCDPHPDLFDYRPEGTADRMVEKCERLRDIMPDSWRRFHPAVAHLAGRLRSIDSPCDSFVLGDVSLGNLLLSDGRLGVFDLDDVGVGDWRRDVADLLQHLSEAEENAYYSRGRVRYFQRLLLDEVGLEPKDTMLSIYRIEYYLDMLWSLCRHRDDRGLPIPRLSGRTVERLMERHVRGMERS